MPTFLGPYNRVTRCENKWICFSAKKTGDTFLQVNKSTVNKSKIAWKSLIANQSLYSAGVLLGSYQEDLSGGFC